MKRPIKIDGAIARVPLTKGFEAIIDAADSALIEGFSWTAKISGKLVYAKRAQMIDGVYVGLAMHRVIAGAPEGVLVDHIDGNGLNNRRANLRFATVSQNLCNRGPQVNNTSGFKGVIWHKSAQKWSAQIKIGRKNKYLGLFDRALDAAHARQRASAEIHGAFGWSDPTIRELEEQGT